MPSQSDVEDLRKALNALSIRAQADLTRMWAGLDTGNIVTVRKALEDVFPDLIAAYSDMGMTVCADMFEVWAHDLGIRPKVAVVAAVNAERANAAMRWAIGQPEALGDLMIIIDKLVKQPGRSLIQKSATTSGGAWARVPTGAETCSWCRMLAGRGAVYETAHTAGEGRKYHGKCDCTPVLVRGSQDYPQGYDPAALADVYDAARQNADSGNPTEILSAMRQITGGN